MTKQHSSMTSRDRAGIYVMQSSGYRAFIPAPLPPDPPIKLEGEFQTLLSQADHALGGSMVRSPPFQTLTFL